MKYRSEVDGLRAVAVLPVILFHAGYGAFSGGFVGVDIFFVISGYLITTIIAQEIDAREFSIVRFYERRARRILPALMFVLFVSMLFSWLWLLPPALEDFGKSLLSVSVFSSNIYFWLSSGYFDTANELKPLLHTWSLAVEEQFYVFFPLMLLLLWRFGQAVVWGAVLLVSVTSLGLAEWGVRHYPEATFYLLPTRCWELMLGSCVAFHLLKNDPAHRPKLANALSAAGLLMIAVSIFTYDNSTPFPGLSALLPAAGTALILLFASPANVTGKFLGSRVPVKIGLISYSAYLWHQPVFAFARLKWGVHDAIAMGALSVVSLAAAYLSWKYIEAPFRKKGKFSSKSIFLLSLASSVIVAAAGYACVATKGFESRLPENALKVLHTSRDYPDDLKPFRTSTDALTASVVLIGDSHADTFFLPLRDALATQGIDIALLTKQGCPPVRGLYRVDIIGMGAACDAHYQKVYARLLNTPSIKTVILSARFPLYLESVRFDNGEGGIETGDTTKVIFESFQHKDAPREDSVRRDTIAQRFSDEIRALVAAGKKVVVVYPIPEAGWDVPTHGMTLALKTSDNVNASTAFSAYTQRSASAVAMLDSLGQYSALKRVYPDRALCNVVETGRCATVIDSTSLYRDGNHLNDHGARRILEDVINSVIE